MPHHAYCIYGEQEEAILQATNFVEQTYNIITRANPDFEILRYDVFSISDVRIFTRRSALSPVTGNIKVYIIAAKRIYNEAQNALLKLLEEPPKGIIIILTVLHKANLLQTVQSRLLPIPLDTSVNAYGNIQNVGSNEATESARVFLSEDSDVRITHIKKLFANGNKKIHIMCTDGVSFLDALELFVYTAYQNATDLVMKEKLQQGLENIEIIRPYLYERSTQARMLFEHIAIVLPSLTV